MQKPQTVAKALASTVLTQASPGRGGHKGAQAAANTAFSCRLALADFFDMKNPEHVVFTFNATHGLNIAINHLVKANDTVVISPWEHNAVTRPLAAIDGVKVRVANAPLFDKQATIDAFERAITSDVKAVVFTHVSNVFGYILPIEEIAAICKSAGKPFIIDASQSAGCVPISFEKIGADFIAMPGHKALYGPQGTGVLLCKSVPDPIIFGGTGSNSLSSEMPSFLPDRLEAGTHNIPGIAGLAKGVAFVKEKGISRIANHERKLIATLKSGLATRNGIQQFAAPNPALQTGVLSFRVANVDCEDLASCLSAHDIAVRAGLHCAPFAHEYAGTIDTGTVRVSVSAFNSQSEIERFLFILKTKCLSQ